MLYILHMGMEKTSRFRLGFLAAAIAATVSFHYGLLIPAGSAHTLLHAIHGRLCYIPIILGAIWFGVRGGVGAALAIALLTLPYVRVKGITDRHTLLGEYTEIVFYIAIGLTAGILIEQQRAERRRSERLQRELAQRERLSSLGQMAAGLAHEIKNPLGSIQGAAELLGDDAPEGSQRRELVDVMRKETRRLNVVVDHFLRFARPRSLSLSRVDAAQLLRDAAAQIEIEARQKTIRIESSVPASLPTIHADAQQLHQVLLNVLLNAIEFSKAGDCIRVEAKAQRREGSDWIDVTVSDTGAGISTSDLPRVFDPFFTTRESGTGLGLAISHTIIHDHGGTIDVSSKEGRGTQVTISLPLKGGARGEA